MLKTFVANKQKRVSAGYIVNAALLILAAVLCLLPLLNMLALSFSDKVSAAGGEVTLWPVGFNLASYKYVLGKTAFWRSFGTTLVRVALGVPLNIVLAILCAYPLSKEKSAFSFRTIYVWFLFFTMLFSGGMIPWYFLIHSLGLMDSVWALVLPGAVPVFSVVLLLNFFRQLPKEFEEAASIDGASQWRIMFQIYVPCSMPSIATITLFSFIFHWNAWFDGMILMNDPRNLPLQSYIQSILIQSNTDMYKYQGWQEYAAMGEKTFKAAQVIVSILPLVIVYPFVQRFFTAGIVMGSVKG